MHRPPRWTTETYGPEQLTAMLTSSARAVRLQGLDSSLSASATDSPNFASTTENAPPGEAGRFWGYYREERTARR